MFRYSKNTTRHRYVSTSACASTSTARFVLLLFLLILFVAQLPMITAAAPDKPPAPTSSDSVELNSFLSAILQASSNASPDFLSGNSAKTTKSALRSDSHHNAHRGVRIADRVKLAEALTGIEKREKGKQQRRHE